MDNAFEMARAAYGTGAYDDATLEFLFPQLKQSEDERIRKEMLDYLKRKSQNTLIPFSLADAQQWIAWLEKQKDLFRDDTKMVRQKSAEWSEEDETMINHIIEAQPKVELTLLDKNIISAAVAFVELNPYNYWCGIDKRTVIKALRSLRPFWKPSEEQMEALIEAMQETRPGWLFNRQLVSLYDDLKKL